MHAPSDPLSDLMSLLSVDTASWARLEAAGVWGLRFPAHALLKFVQVARGGCQIVVEDGDAIALRTGDMLILLNTRGYVIGSEGAADVQDGEALFASFEGTVVTLNGDDTLLCSVHYALASGTLDLLLRLLPRVLVIPAGHPSAGALRRSNDFLLEELQRRGAGSAMMIQHLCGMLLLQTVRAYLGRRRGPRARMAGRAGRCARRPRPGAVACAARTHVHARHAGEGGGVVPLGPRAALPRNGRHAAAELLDLVADAAGSTGAGDRRAAAGESVQEPGLQLGKRVRNGFQADVRRLTRPVRPAVGGQSRAPA